MFALATGVRFSPYCNNNIKHVRVINLIKNNDKSLSVKNIKTILYI